MGVMGSQRPFSPRPFFALLHAMHRPAQSESQQNPSTQFPEAHSLAFSHRTPGPFCAQKPSVQTLLAQSPFPTQR
jgi:hypothetical protein